MCGKHISLSCSQGKGTLILEDLSVQVGNINTVFTRAVENDLYVEIWQNGQLMSGQQYEPGKVPAKLDLPAGSYLLDKLYHLWKHTLLHDPMYRLMRNKNLYA